MIKTEKVRTIPKIFLKNKKTCSRARKDLMDHTSLTSIRAIGPFPFPSLSFPLSFSLKIIYLYIICLFLYSLLIDFFSSFFFFSFSFPFLSLPFPFKHNVKCFCSVSYRKDFFDYDARISKGHEPSGVRRLH